MRLYLLCGFSQYFGLLAKITNLLNLQICRCNHKNFNFLENQTLYVKINSYLITVYIFLSGQNIFGYISEGKTLNQVVVW